jgi:glycosyltransferase involved in cell wall biosynthesis
VEYVGEIGEAEKSKFLGDALALLFPIDWPEPFGLVMIEAMATGTPVIAFNRGSVPEVVEQGVTGFVVNSVEEAAEATKLVSSLDRARIRATFERRFSSDAMAIGYEEAYQAVLEIADGMARPAKLAARGAKDRQPAEIQVPPTIAAEAAA